MHKESLFDSKRRHTTLFAGQKETRNIFSRTQLIWSLFVHQHVQSISNPNLCTQSCSFQLSRHMMGGGEERERERSGIGWVGSNVAGFLDNPFPPHI